MLCVHVNVTETHAHQVQPSMTYWEQKKEKQILESTKIWFHCIVSLSVRDLFMMHLTYKLPTYLSFSYVSVQASDCLEYEPGANLRAFKVEAKKVCHVKLKCVKSAPVKRYNQLWLLECHLECLLDLHLKPLVWMPKTQQDLVRRQTESVDLRINGSCWGDLKKKEAVHALTLLGTPAQREGLCWVWRLVQVLCRCRRRTCEGCSCT